MRFLGFPVQHVQPSYREKYIGDYDHAGRWLGDREDWDRIHWRLVFPPAFRGPVFAAIRAHRRKMNFEPFSTEAWREPWIEIPSRPVVLASSAAERATSISVSGAQVRAGMFFTIAGDRKVYEFAESGSGSLDINVKLRKAATSGSAIDLTPNAYVRYSPTGTYDESYRWEQQITVAVDIEEALE